MKNVGYIIRRFYREKKRKIKTKKKEKFSEKISLKTTEHHCCAPINEPR